MPTSSPSPTVELVYAVVKRVPAGRVATYGQIAKLIGFPKHSRYIGFALRQLPAGNRIPWHRIVNSKGEIAARSSRTADRDCESEQHWRLQDEGIEFDDAGRVSLKKYQWKPRRN